MAPQSTPWGDSSFMAHHWSVWARATISSHLFNQMFWEPWNPAFNGGRKSLYHNLVRLGRAPCQPYCSCWDSGSWSATVCLLARSCTCRSPRFPASTWHSNLNSYHQFGISHFFFDIGPFTGVTWVWNWQASGLSPSLIFFFLRWVTVGSCGRKCRCT